MTSYFVICLCTRWFPRGLQKEKTFSTGSGILPKVLEKRGNFTQNTGKVRQFYPKYWKSEAIWASFYFKFFSDLLIEVYLLNRFLYLLKSLNKTLQNRRKILEKSGKFVSPRMWEPWTILIGIYCSVCEF